MSVVVLVLAIVGALAVAQRAVATAASALRLRVEAFLAAEVAATRRQRGDLTGMEEARVGVRDARRAARYRGGRAAGWLLLLIAPVATPWTGPIYAAYGVLWLLLRLAGTGRRS
jgi:hypothetical protein